MKVARAAILDRLKADATLNGLMGSLGGAASWFKRSPAPGGATRPLGFVLKTDDSAWDTKSEEGRELEFAITVLVDADGSGGSLDDIMESVRALFHELGLTIAGYTTTSVTCSGPEPVETDDKTYAEQVRVRMRIEKE